jgi:carboxymethylenebutenolidase
MKAYCTRLAESVFIAFAPDLYHTKVADNIAGAEALGDALDNNFVQAKAEIAEAANFLNEHVSQTGDDLAVIAFSLGVYYALSVPSPWLSRSVLLTTGCNQQRPPVRAPGWSSELKCSSNAC